MRKSRHEGKVRRRGEFSEVKDQRPSMKFYQRAHGKAHLILFSNEENFSSKGIALNIKIDRTETPYSDKTNIALCALDPREEYFFLKLPLQLFITSFRINLQLQSNSKL